MAIEAEVRRNDQLLMQRTYYENTLDLKTVLAKLEDYIRREQLNVDGECLVRVRFNNLKAI